MGWRRESALYTASFGLFLFVSPWLFAYASEVARIDVWAGSAAVVAISIAAIVAFSDWEEWLNVLLGGIAGGTGVYAYQGDARQHWARRNGYVRRSP
jgi:hypothetical protein